MTIQNIIKFINTTDYFIIFILIIITYIFNFYYKHFTRINPIPCPLPLPFIGNLHNLGYDVAIFYKQCQQKYGDISEAILDRRYIILSRPEYIEKFFDRRIFFMRPYSQGADEIGMYGRGTFFNNNYKSWKHNNKFFTDTFISQRFIDNAIKSTNELYKELSNYWQSLGNQNSSNNSNDNWTLETDFSQWFNRFTNDIVSIISTGERTYSIASYYNTQSLINNICKNPHVKQKMLSEIDHVLPKSIDKFCVSYNDLQKLRYCEAIIKEACRLVPVVPFTFRAITKECEIAGYKWPPGTNFLLNFLAVQVHPEFWPNPEVFNPDRFYNDDQNDKRLGDKSAFMMFGGGKRICPGRMLAMVELLLLMVLVYENYNVELVNMNEPLKTSSQLSTQCKEIRVRISLRT
ncbi:cytochrome P450 [Gigaspora margarita]|uniref:Cytochrome P450 n=1 Tax=Gigaspora margarita TaxID=4874 RepID=A0A8H3WXF6_GIGMA|nr:cytochrome P450 [Gigaspora margarita]